MPEHSEIEENISLIKDVFQAAQLEFKSHSGDLEKLYPYLKQSSNIFNGIKFEAIAFESALYDLSIGSNLDTWHTFLKKFPDYGIQIHIGLGWALAKQNVPLNTLKHEGDMYSSRILDGMGYYWGMFRYRKLVLLIDEAQKVNLNLKMIAIGIGRSLWYRSKGDLKKINWTLFPDEMLPAVWNGLGIAIHYVGACNVLIKDQIRTVSEKYYYDFLLGILMCCYSDFMSGNRDSMAKSSFWFDQKSDRLPEKLHRIQANNKSQLSFESWKQELIGILDDLLVDNNL